MQSTRGQPRHPSGTTADGKGDGRGRQGRARVPIEELKRRSRCTNCGEKGHWHKEECKKPAQSRPASSTSSPAGFVYVALDGNNGIESHGFCGATSWMSVDPGTALVDTAAAQALMGERSLERWEKQLEHVGLRVIPVNRPLPGAHGVGGAGRVLKAVLVPVGIGGKHGVIEFLILHGEVPHLLPVDFLASLQAVFDLPKKKITLGALSTSSTLEKLSSSHRAMRVDEFSRDFESPSSARLQWPALNSRSF